MKNKVIVKQGVLSSFISGTLENIVICKNGVMYLKSDKELNKKRNIKRNSKK